MALLSWFATFATGAPRNQYAPPPPRSPRGPLAIRGAPVGTAAVITYAASLPPPDTSAPTVDNFGTSSGTPNTPAARLKFDVTDNAGMRKIMVLVQYPAYGTTEVAYDGDNFLNAYAGSTQVIEGGLRFILWHRIGWPTSPTIRVTAIDTAANEAT